MGRPMQVDLLIETTAGSGREGVDDVLQDGVPVKARPRAVTRLGASASRAGRRARDAKITSRLRT